MNWHDVRALDTAEKRWPKTEYAVEAYGWEELALWQEWHEHATWEQCHGWMIHLGDVFIARSSA